MHFANHDADQAVAPYIDGALRDSASTNTIQVTNPSNGRGLLSIPTGCNLDVDRAVASARRAFDHGEWSETPPSVRARTLYRLADLIEKNASLLDAFDAAEMGKPISLSALNANAAAGLMRFFAGAVNKVMGDVFSSDRNSFVAHRRVPRGVVAAIVPWNFPTFVAVLKIAPALASGNCVILKPSELSSRSAVKLAELAVAAGLPGGVLNVVPGEGETVGRLLGQHKDVDMVTFTGSTAVGKQMLHYSAQSNMKVVMTECGGKSPQIVFADSVDLDAACESIASALVTNQGQICSVGSRLLVQKSIATEVVERLVARVQRITIGDALDPNTTFGPLASAQQHARVLDYIAGARQERVELVAGGRSTLPESGGYFVEPTIFSGVSSTARIAQEEIFGPVLSVIPFEDEAEAVRIANGTMYGLMAYVWTASLSTGMRMTKQIRSSVIVNASAPTGEGPGHGFSSEPAGQSGIGVEGGIAGMESYLRRQLVWFNHA
jgi:acyl-CoA reductase-like NAD-dependent aldehyde dehydrogenase